VPSASASLPAAERIREVSAWRSVRAATPSWAAGTGRSASASAWDAAPSKRLRVLRLIASLPGLQLSPASRTWSADGACTWSLRGRRVDERPLVVVRPALVETNRRVGALARHADDAANDCGSTRRRGARGGLLTSSLLSGALSSRTLTLLSRLAAPLTRAWRVRQRDEVVVRDRVFVLLTQKLLLHKDIEIRRIRVRRPALKHADGVRVLLAPENQLRFFFALRHLLPDRHRRRHQHRHDSQTDDQRGHGVASFAPSSCCFALTR